MRRVLIVTTAIAVLVVLPARAQLVGQPSGQGGGAPPPTPYSSTIPPTVPNTSGTPQSQDPLLQLQGSSSELQGSASELQGSISPYSPSPYSPSPRVRALNQLTRPGAGQAERPEGPLR